MAKTVNKLAKLSGISVRTLHYYDEIGLLKPAFIGENNYRYYEETQCLRLQQILFYRELGLPLGDIQRILSNPDFNPIEALESHKKILEKNLNHTQQLIETVDKTIAHLRGETMLNLEEIFAGFDKSKQNLYEEFLMDSGISESIINQSKNRINKWTKEEWLSYKKEGDSLHKQLTEAIDQGFKPSSLEVQGLVKKHFEYVKKIWTPNKESYIGLGELYSSHPDFVTFYDNIHPQLLSFLKEAMSFFAKANLS